MFMPCCLRPDPLSRGSRHSINGLLGPDGRHLTRNSISLKSLSIAAKQERGVPWGL